MDSVIFNPMEEFDSKYKAKHLEHTTRFFDSLVKQSGVDIEQNRKTVALYEQHCERLAELRKKLTWLRFFRVLMCITLVLIPLVILKLNPRIRTLKSEIEEADKRDDELLQQAQRQMEPLSRLFSDRDSLTLIESTLPSLKFEPCLSVRQEADMKINYDFDGDSDIEESTIDVLAGSYNDNPFLFENKLIHTMGTETYHGYRTIHWTETYRDSNGHLRTRTRSQTLHATVTKPKPFYSTRVVLNYCSQGGPDLSFSRDATNLDEKNERQIDRYVRRGERRLKRKTDRAISDGGDFMSMSNTDFEVLFDALDRNNEVQFRTLFTPLAQTNMVDLLLSKTGYGDDFNFVKCKRTNRIISEHSQGRDMILQAESYRSHSYDVIRSNFIDKNTEFFKAVYFDFAPLWAIPMYQERPVHSLKPIPDYTQLYSLKESEALANLLDARQVVHPHTKTQAILKASFVSSRGGVDKTKVTAYSYDIIGRVDIIPVLGGDGRFHNVSVRWDDYIPLVSRNDFYIADADSAADKPVMARRNGLCIYDS